MNEKTEQIQAETPPPTVASGKSGVRRVNSMPMYIIGGALCAFLLIMMLVASDRAAKQNTPGQGTTELAGNTSMFAREIVGENEGGVIEPARMLIPPDVSDNEDNAILVARPDPQDMPPLPPHPLSISGNEHLMSMPDPEAERIRAARMQAFQEAVRAKTQVRMTTVFSSGGSVGRLDDMPQSREEMLAQLAAVRQQIDAQRELDPTAAYQQRLAQLRDSGILSSADMGGSFAGGAPQLFQASTTGNDYEQFARSGGGDRWQLESYLKAPRSPYELRTGFVIPATLISGINSDLPGQIVAQVAQHVYDTPTGQHILIPQGARLVGAYSNDVAYGQKRVLVAWQRIIFPDGKALDIGSMPGADSSGYSGFNDKVNNHYGRMFGSALLMSGIVAGINLSQNNRGNFAGNQQRASDALSEALGQVLGNTIAQVVSRNMNIAPTLEIRPGYRFNVVVTKDITFVKPYQSFDYQL